jgi:sulfotransferase
MARRTLLDDSLAVVPEERIRTVVRGIVNSYYEDSGPDKVVFDSARGWTTIPSLDTIFPASKIICCVRSPAWIYDSIERKVRSNYWTGIPLLFGRGVEVPDVYSRIDHLSKNLVGGSIRALRTAWFGPEAAQLICVRYESLTEQPKETIDRLYDALGEQRFPHYFTGIKYEHEAFDRAIGLDGFHTVHPDVTPTRRETILPLDLFLSHDRCFWDDKRENPRGITIL